MKTPPLSRRGFLTGLASLAVASSLRAYGLLPTSPKKWDSSMEVAVDVTIATVQGMRVHRPYVAVYIEDEAGKVVRTLSLWVQTERRGPRWIPDLRRWWSGTDHDKLVPTVSSATRNAGKYSLAWDGKGDDGKVVTQGKYTVVIEAAREHGTYGVLKQPIEIGKKTFTAKVEGNVEIEGATVEYRKRAK